MAMFATADDLADRLGITLSVAEQARAESLLVRASGLIQAEARQTIEQVTDDTLTRRGTVDATILLPERPVVSVASVTLDGGALTDWYLDGNQLVRRRTLLGSILETTDLGWGDESQELVIVYTHGYATIPEDLQAIAVEAVVRVWVNPGSVVSERAGSEQTQYTQTADPSGLLLTSTERRTIRRRFGNAAGSVSQS